jgi:hypothetical protein
VLDTDFTVIQPDVTSPIPDGNFFAAVSQDPLRSMIVWKPNNAAATWLYFGVTITELGQEVTNFPLTVNEGGPPFLGGNKQWVSIVMDKYISFEVYRPHGPTLYPISVEGRKYVWIDATAGRPTTLELALTVAMAEAGAVRLHRFDGSDEILVIEQDFALADPIWTYSLAEAGYYAIDLYYTVGLQTGVASVNIIGTSGNFAHLTLPGIEDHRSIVTGIRVNAAALMLTPHGSSATLAGTVTGVQLQTGVSWRTAVKTPDLLTAFDDSTEMPLKKGIYGFMKPSSTHVYDIQIPFKTNSNGVLKSYYVAPQPINGWLVISASTGLEDGAYPGGSCHLTATFGVEFSTKDAWQYTSPPLYSTLVFDQAQEILRTAPQWHENPAHWADILNFLRKTGKGVLSMAPTLLAVARILAPQFSPAYDVADKVAHAFA